MRLIFPRISPIFIPSKINEVKRPKWKTQTHNSAESRVELTETLKLIESDCNLSKQEKVFKHVRQQKVHFCGFELFLAY